MEVRCEPNTYRVEPAPDCVLTTYNNCYFRENTSEPTQSLFFERTNSQNVFNKPYSFKLRVLYILNKKIRIACMLMNQWLVLAQIHSGKTLVFEFLFSTDIFFQPFSHSVQATLAKKKGICDKEESGYACHNIITSSSH